MWDWWSDTVDTVVDAVSDGWEWANDVVDTYIWDTGSDEAVIESWVRDTFDIPDQEGKSFVGEAWDKANELVDTYIWDTSEKEAVAESWVYNQWYEPWLNTAAAVEEVVADFDEIWDDYTEPAKKAASEAAETVTTAYKAAADTAGDIINNIMLTLGVGFDAAMAAIGFLPDLIMGLKTDLANWFEIDVDKLITGWKDIQEKMKPVEEG